MPHQLRRIITINIKNPKDGMPSGRIAEMDPRGGVLAVGINGVGKTTFLRLLPLFYGATPTQILKGSGRTALIGHTLPDSSSAVCYEYERETENDVRCVVMHARQDEEAPQFYIINGHYRETFFYDENNQFVGREEFKARVESMGVEVTRKLTLHQYRSVILNERLTTKEGIELRRLAAIHSLSPGPLYNLDQIAAAMANEKISFRDFKNIVVERVADNNTAASSATNIKELKQNRESVIRWLEAKTHLAEIMAQKPTAMKLTGEIATVKRLHIELCSLHIAVKAALEQIAKEINESRSNEVTLRAGFEAQSVSILDGIREKQHQLSESTEKRDTLQKKVKDQEGQLRHFSAIDVTAMAALQNSEADLQAQLIQKTRERQDLEGVAGGLSTEASVRASTVNTEAASQLGAIDVRQREHLKTLDVRSEELRKSEIAALAQIVQPQRLSEITDKRLQIAAQIGELKPLLDSPTASPSAIQSAKEADEAFDRANDDYRVTVEALREARHDLQSAHTKNTASIERVDKLREQAAAIGLKIERAQARLTPAPGTLLEFIRNSEATDWSAAAKVLNPDLLTREDLAPTYLGEVDAINGRVQLGAALLHVDEVAAPGWLHMEGVHQELKRLNSELQTVTDELAVATSDSQKDAKNLRAAEKNESAVSARESLSKGSCNTARENKARTALFVREEAMRRKEGAQKQKAQLELQKAALDVEEAKLKTGLSQAQDAIRSDFENQRLSLAADKGKQETHYEGERAGVKRRQEKQLLDIEADLKRALEGIGIDPQRISDLTKSIDDLGQSLATITAHRHEVAAWLAFQRDVLPMMEADRQDLTRCIELCTEINSEKSRLDEALAALQTRAGRELKKIEESIERSEAESKRLSGLRVRDLQDYQDYVPTNLHIDWAPAELEASVDQRKKLLDSTVASLQKEKSALRNTILKLPGGPADWLESKEKELPDPQTLMSHQNLCEQTQVLCDWFYPTESGPYIDQLNKEMAAYFNLAGEFVRVLDQFERRVTAFNRELQKALTATEHFARFKDLSVQVSSNVGQLGHLKLLREMQDRSARTSLSFRAAALTERDLPTDEDTALVRSFREVLQNDGAFRINLHDQVRLECSLYENGKRQVVSNEEEFRSISSNGNSALITAVFLMGFVQMIRGDSPVRLTWLVDEIGRFDGGNLSAFLHTLDKNRIDVISACPSLDPALARYFKRICLFEDSGAVFSSENELEVLNAAA